MNIFYKDEDIWFGWSEQEGTISLHVGVNTWSVKKYKEYIQIFANFLNNFSGKTIYAMAKTNKARKFNELFGLTCVGKNEDGYIMGIKA